MPFSRAPLGFVSYGAAQWKLIGQLRLSFSTLFDDCGVPIFLNRFTFCIHVEREAGGNWDSSCCQNATFVLSRRRCHALNQHDEYAERTVLPEPEAIANTGLEIGWRLALKSLRVHVQKHREDTKEAFASKSKSAESAEVGPDWKLHFGRRDHNLFRTP